MSVLMWMWAALTTALVLVLIYRSALATHEDDQLFLDSAEAHLEKEQQLLAIRMDRLRPIVLGLGASSAVLIVAMAALWLYHALNS